jgi:hypothetical protein
LKVMPRADSSDVCIKNDPTEHVNNKKWSKVTVWSILRISFVFLSLVFFR